MKRLLFCSATFKTGHGGVASYGQDFVHAFENEYDITVITSDGYEKQDGDKFELIALDTFNWSKKNAIRLLSIISDIKPNILVNSNFPLLTLVSPYVSNEIKLINVSHYTNGKLACNAGLNGNYSDEIISMSVYAKAFIDNKFKIEDSDKVKIIYNYMEESNEEYKGKAKVGCQKIVFPGGSFFHKGPDVVGMALKKLLRTDFDFEFYWLGFSKLPGGQWWFTRTKRIEDVFGSLDNRIKHVGKVSREEAKKIMSECNIFLLPSRNEGCPITLIEAMRSGCIPIISDAKHGSLDLIEDGKTGFVTRLGNSDDIVSCITKIIKSPRKYDYIYENVLDKFSKDLKKSVWLDKMTKLLKSKPNHKKRRKSFSYAQFFKDRLRLWSEHSSFEAKGYILDNLYLTFYFRYLRYLVK